MSVLTDLRVARWKERDDVGCEASIVFGPFDLTGRNVH